MEESDSKAESEVLSCNVQKDVNKHSKESICETSKFSVESDDEMSTILDCIEDKITDPTIVKENSSFSLNKYNDEQSEDSSVEGNLLFSFS